ncbi:MAG: hypothetical protein K5883_09565, partial [Pseudobutyrivibrio sp.]|nr:hypothetical protein [Pseudobutyrivibrio sp.]
NPIEYVDGYTFTDTFGDGQDYVAGSFKINESDSDKASINGSKLSWTYKDNDAAAVNTFTYQTKMDILANLSKNNNGGKASATVQNKVEVTAPAGEGYKELEISDSASSTFNKNIVKWIDKEGGEVNANGVASWTVTVQNNGFDVYDVILTDKIVADSGVEITISDLKVVDGSGNEVTMPSGKYSYASNTQTFNFGEMSGTKKYVVTYKTKIENFGTYLKENHAVPKNEATITYKYKKGNGEEVVIPKGPTVGKDFENELLDPKAAIGKVAAGYDASTHTIKWNVTVNKSKQTLTNVKVTDILPKDNKFESISNIKKGDADFSLADASIDTSKAGEVTFTFGELKEVLTFTVTTKLTNNNVWASNATETYTNIVNLYYGSDKEVKATDSAPQVCKSNVIEKTAGTYDYSTRTIPYTIVVDTNNMLMDTVVVTDILNEKLEYVDGSATGATPTYDKTTNTLTFSLGTINGKQTITFNAKVKDGDTFKDSGDIIIKNNATLTSDQCSVSTTTSDTTTKITNKVISKAGKRNNEVIDYTVSLNPAQQKLYTDTSINEVVIQDTLGASLSLKEDSIHLYEATVATDGSLTKNVEITSPTIRTNIVNGKTVLEVVVPKDKDGKAFVLTYTAYMLNAEAGDFKNNVLLKGYGAEEKNVSEVSYKQTDFSSVNFNNYTYYVAELRDENDPTILLKEGHFQMVDPSSGKVIAEADISSKGEILLKGVDIKPNTEYKIIQTSAPEGYIIPEEYKTGKTITTPDKGLNAAKNQKASNTLYNAKPTKEISISKEDGLGNAVTGAKLSITWKDSAGTKQTAESWTSGSAAKTFKASADILYTLTEESTPFGYKTANPIDFKVGTDGTLYKREGNAFNSIGSDKLVMIDVPMNSATISISKISATQGNNIEGAELIISKSAGGSNPLAQWTSSESAKQLSLPDGQYYLIEASAPVGYEKADAIPFEITADLELKVNGEIVSDKKIIMKDEYSSSTDVDGNDTSPKATVTFSPTTLGIDPDIFKSMKFAIFTKDSLSKKLTKVDWFNFDEDNQEYEYNLNYQDEYVIMPEGEIEGYDPVEPITFKVIGEEDGSGNIVTSMKMKTPGDTFKEASLTDIGKKATPKPIPEPVVEPEIPSNETPSPKNADPLISSTAGDDNKVDEPKNAEVADNVSKKNSSSDDDSSDSSSSSHSYAAAKATNPVDALTFKDVEVNYGADTDEQSQPEEANGPRLAKTGGFIGTMAGYGVSIFLILFGLYLVFGKKKNYK